MDIKGLLKQLEDEGQVSRILANPLAQFGTANRSYLGATILPEKTVTENKYREEGIKFRSIIANNGTRYSPVQLKGGIHVASFDVELSNSDIGSQFTGADYDALLNMLLRAGSDGTITTQAMVQILNWIDWTINRPLVERNEKMRWDALVDASIVLTGDDGYTETVSLSNPSGHRVAAAAAWSNDANDPMDDIMLGVEKLAEKGYTVNRIFAGQPVITKLQKNEKMRQRSGTVAIIGGVSAGLPARSSVTAINGIMSDNDLPPIEPYNLQYRTQESNGYFLKRDVVVMVATTGQDAVIDLGDDEPLVVQDTLGYTAVGRPTGQAAPGRASYVAEHSNKPPRIEAEGWQTSLPVVTEPEAVYVITSIT